MHTKAMVFLTAISACVLAQDAGPGQDTLRVHLQAADSLLALSKREAALEHLAAAVAFAPHEHGVRLRYALLLTETAGECREAAQRLRAEYDTKAVDDPADAELLQRLGREASAQQALVDAHARQAAAQLELLQLAKPKSAEIAVQLGRAWCLCGAWVEARDALKRSLELVDPNDPAVPQVRQLLEMVEQLAADERP